MDTTQPRPLYAHKTTEGGHTKFGKAYFAYCQSRGLSLSSSVLSPALEHKRQLWLDVEKLKKDEDWDPIFHAYYAGFDELEELHVYCNWDSNRSLQRAQMENTDTSKLLPKAVRANHFLSTSKIHTRFAKYVFFIFALLYRLKILN